LNERFDVAFPGGGASITLAAGVSTTVERRDVVDGVRPRLGFERP